MASGLTVKLTILRVVQPVELIGPLRIIGSVHVSGEYVIHEVVPNPCPSCNGRCVAWGIERRRAVCQ